jgi:GntR family transcriptional regulator
MYAPGLTARKDYATQRDRMIGGDLRSGMKLPSPTDLATAFGIAPMTVRSVLAQLDDEGLVVRKPRRGNPWRT